MRIDTGCTALGVIADIMFMYGDAISFGWQLLLA